MTPGEYERFSDILQASLDVYGRERSAVAVALWFKVLERYPLADIEAALADHLRENRFAPTPADVAGRIAGNDGRPGPEEAWAMIPRGESESLVWNEEMARAYGIAAPLLAAGDAIAARKAFIEAYSSEVARSRARQQPQLLTPSWGWDPAGRERAVQLAVERGLLPQDKAGQLLEVAGRGQLFTLVLKLPKSVVKSIPMESVQ